MGSAALNNYFEYEDINEELGTDDLDIADKNTAVKMMAKLDNVQNRIEDLNDYKREKVKILKEKIETLEEEAEVIRKGLEVFILEQNDGETLSYPDVGTAYVSVKDKIKIEDEKEALSYIENMLEEDKHEDFIRVKKSIRKRNFKSFVEEQLNSTGQLVPGTKQEENKTFVYRSPSK
jgi:hypothetical protein